MSIPLDRSRFLAEIKKVFPEIKSEINAQDGQLHFEVAVLRQHAERMIAEGNKDAVSCIFSIADRFYNNGDSKLKNAIDVSFVEEMDFTSSKKSERSWVWDSFPERLKELYKAFHGTSGWSLWKKAFFI